MGTLCRALLLLGLSSLVLIASGCKTLSIAPLHPANPPPVAETPFPDVIVIEDLRVGASAYTDAQPWQDALPAHLEAGHVFAGVVRVDRSTGSERFQLGGEVSGDFRPGGVANFFTWFPGPLVLSHGWRGTRFIYDVSADLELVDTGTKEIVSRYHVETSHQLSHRSYNPGPMFGAVLVIPGVVKGILTTKPRATYRRLVYESAYADLWKRATDEITAERGTYYRQRVRSAEPPR